MKKIVSKIKSCSRWAIAGGTLFFLLSTLRSNWQEVAAIEIESHSWLMLAIALIVTFLAHIWSGWVWTWILQDLKYNLKTTKAVRVYLKTNVAKYLPGNVWHYYGRIEAICKVGNSLGSASCSVLLEPLLMAAAALIIVIIGSSFGLVSEYNLAELQIFGLIAILLGIHPCILNPLIQRLNRLKGKTDNCDCYRLQRYPLAPLIGELGFVILRGIGFLFVCQGLMFVNLDRIPQLVTIFSLAWLLGLIVPGAPGGMGVFETVAIASFDPNYFPQASILAAVALYRLVSIIAEAIAASLASIELKKSVNI
ncbi:MAG: lysylphosphatidylglycerol synthase domain-containing protein [Prochloraceae cyanobacterium]|nr:lysylphosphatidylglycerol synthase domain-containing protein [Prochloraceae cyanobacterium]